MAIVQMSDKKEVSSLALKEYNSSLMNEMNNPHFSTPSQPFIFRQYTVREVVTPTKQGNISMKEMSFSMCGGGWCSSPSEAEENKPSILNISLSTNSHSSKSPERDFFPLSRKPLWTSSSEKNSECIKTLFGTPDKSSSIRSRNKTSPPSKKVKMDLPNGPQRKLIGNHKSSEKGKVHIQIKDVPKLHRKYIFLIALLPLLAFTGILCCIFPFYEEVTLKSEGKLQPLQNILNERVFGQEKALTSLLKILESYLSKGIVVDMPVILITGSSGVGKSFTSSFIANNFPPPGKAEIVLSPLPSSKVILRKFSERGLNMIIIDGLNPFYISETVSWMQNLFNEAMWQNKPVLSALILNDQMWDDELTVKTGTSQDTSDAKVDKLNKQLTSSGFSSHHIPFDSLSKEHVESCIRVALEKRGIHDNFRTTKYVDIISSNVNFREEGCKSVWSRTGMASFD